MHHVLHDIGLIGTKGSSNAAAEVLSRLLETQAVSKEQVLQAYKESIQQKKKSNQRPPKDSSRDSQHPRRRHIALKFYYDGAKYSGLAENVGIENDNSVEKALFAALRKARLVESRESCAYSRCGRTDSGVSAAGQVVALKVRSAFAMDASFDEQGHSLFRDADLPKNSLDEKEVWIIPRKKGKPRELRKLRELEYDNILNKLLPEDIRVLAWCPVSDEFSARFSATTRTYRYFFLPRHMDLRKMQLGLDLMVGTHDFRNFCKMDVEKVYNFERKIHKADLLDDGNGNHYIRIVGQAFLWHQIRCIVSVLFMIGRGLEEPEVVSELLDVSKNPGKPSYPLANELPLVLHECGYPNLEFGYSVSNLWNVVCCMEKHWENLILAAARIRSCLGELGEAMVQVEELQRFGESKYAERSKKLPSVGTGKAIPALPGSQFISWSMASAWLESIGCYTDPEESHVVVHKSLLERSRGTTYEEKVASLQRSDRRRERYQENIVKKRKTKEEDSAFYSHKTNQGGSAY